MLINNKYILFCFVFLYLNQPNSRCTTFSFAFFFESTLFRYFKRVFFFFVLISTTFSPPHLFLFLFLSIRHTPSLRSILSFFISQFYVWKFSFQSLFISLYISDIGYLCGKVKFHLLHRNLL